VSGSGPSATIERMTSFGKVSRWTSRFRARSIGSVGSPCNLPRRTWNLKKSRKIERLLL
jgi:hypothetical protein